MYRRFGSRLSCGFCVCVVPFLFFWGGGKGGEIWEILLNIFFILFYFYSPILHVRCMCFFCVLGAWMVRRWVCGLIGLWRDVFPFYFCYFSSTVKKSAVPGNLNRSRLPWPFGRVNVAAAFVFFFFIGLPYDTSTIQPAVHQILALFIQQEFHTSNFTSMILIQ